MEFIVLSYQTIIILTLLQKTIGKVETPASNWSQAPCLNEKKNIKKAWAYNVKPSPVVTIFPHVL